MSILVHYAPFQVPEVTQATPGFARTYARNLLTKENFAAKTIEAVELIVSELVTNVALHVGGALTLEITITRDCLIVVRCVDSSTSSIRPAESYGTESEHGFGLLLVQALADSVVETFPAEGGKALTVTIDPAHLVTGGTHV